MKKFVVFLLVLTLCMPSSLADACFCVAIGKDASPTGYPIIVHNEDDSNTDTMMHYWVPARDDWPAGYTLPAESGTSPLRSPNIPQLAHTNGFYYGEVKSQFGVGASSACGMLNEYGVSVMSNQCSSNVTAAQAVINADGGFHFNLRRAVAERATSSRHAAEIVAQMMNDWGYTDSGRTYTIGDYKEIWLVHVARGQQYVATRVPDDHVAVMPNHFTIQKLDEYSKTGPYASANADQLYRTDILSYTRTTFPTRFPVASADSDFSWRDIYRSGSGGNAGLSTGNTRRQSIAEYYMVGIPISDDMATNDWHAARTFKFSNKITGKVTIEQIFNTYTCHYEGLTWGSAPGRGHSGGTCASGTIESKIVQFHQNLALTTLWTAFGRPCALPYVPLHPLAYGPNIEKMVPDAVQYSISESNYRLANHFQNLQDHKIYRGNRQDRLRSLQYMLNTGYSQYYNDIKGLNLNYLSTMFSENNTLIATNPTSADLAAFDRSASDKAFKMQQDYIDSKPLFGVPVYATENIDRSNASQTQVDIFFEMPEGKTPSANYMRLALGSTEPSSANIMSGSLTSLGNNKWKFTMTKANLTGSSGVGTGGMNGLYQFVFGGQTTDATPEYFSGIAVLNFAPASATYEIVVSTLNPFATAVLDGTYTPPEGQTVTITNIGTSSVLLDDPVSKYYDIKLSQTAIVPGNSATLTVRPKAGLSAGPYSETIRITGTEVNSEVEASFMVVSADYTLSASPLDLTFTPALSPTYTPPATQTVTITNNGTGAVTLTQPTSTNFNLGTLSATSLAPNATATFTVQPKANLAAGNYMERINISGNNGANTSVAAFFVVPAATYTLSAAPIDLAFALALSPSYTQPAAKTVTITNSGTGAVTLTQPTATYYNIGNLSTTNLAAGGTATFTVQPKTGLTSNTYVERINIAGNNGASCAAVASFTVAAESYSIGTLTPIHLSFNEVKGSSYTLPDELTVEMTNNGTGTITLIQPTATYFDIGDLSVINLAPGETVTFTVCPKTGLDPDVYVELIEIVGNNGASSVIVASFTVKDDSGSSGCNAGLPLLALVMAVPFVIRRRK